ncbi:MAG: Uma2 family endonuclease [Anaerolineae bacterium]|nr:Uma2 family endonuclease [Anaerolineae bacterium]
MQTDIARRTMTAVDFEQYTSLPENRDRRLELIEGEVIEVVSDYGASESAARILILMGGFVLERHLGRVTGADGGYAVGDDHFIPDVAFIASARYRKGTSPAWCPVAPDLAVEVLSPGNSEPEMRLKTASYLYAGTTMWIVDPDRKRVEVYTPGKPPFTAGVQDTLTGGEVLPGFTLAVNDIFPE